MENQPTILIVDDEPLVCASMREILELKDYNVIEASNGVSGLKICAETKIDLIILDLNMPRMDGYMFMENLRQRWEDAGRSYKLPKVIVISAVDQKTDMGLSKTLGADLFMSKPFRSNELLNTVASLLS